MISPLDPGDNRNPEFFSGAPPFAVQDVVLQQSEEGLRCRVVPGSTDPPHRPDKAMLAQSVDECPRSKTAIRGLSARAPGHLATPDHRAVQDIHGKASLHPVTYRVADDMSRSGVLDRTQVELALTCGVLGVGRPQTINICGGEVLPDRRPPFPFPSPRRALAALALLKAGGLYLLVHWQ